MEHNKSWRWRRKPSEKIIVADGRASLPIERNVDEDQGAEMGSSRCASDLSERLASVLGDCTTKDELIRKHARMAEQALAGQQMAESEAAFLKQELNKALQQGEAAEQRLAQLDAALKDCMKEIESLQGVQDFEKMQKKLEAKLAESNKRVSNLSAENSNLMKALLCKEKLIEDLDRGKGQLEAEFEMLMERLDLIEKENTYLKYECSVLDEELKLRNVEKGHNHRSALENAKKIKRLEAECQQLRNLVRKRLQGPAVAMNMKPSKGTSFLIERLYDLEEENKALREILCLSDSELKSWRIKCNEMAARLAEVEAHLREISQTDEKSMQLAISSAGVKINDVLDDSDTWANALLAELEQFRKENVKNQPEVQALETGAMGDLAIVAIDTPRKHDSWLDEVLKLVLEEHRVSNRSFSDLLHDIKIVMGCNDDLIKQKEEQHSNISGLLPWKCSNVEEASFTMEKIQLAKMNRGTKEKLQLSSEENTALKKQLRESNETIESLRREVEGLKEAKGVIEEQMENQRLINEDLDTQLTVAKAKLNEILHKLSSLEVELEDKNNCCEELEATCLELQLQLETISRKGSPTPETDQVAMILRSEMMQNLEKQLIPLSPVEVLCPTTTVTATKSPVSNKKSLKPQRSSLRDRMLAEDNNDDQRPDSKSPDSKQKPTEDLQKPSSIDNYDKKQSPEQVGNLAIVPSKKPSGGFGFIRKLFLRRKGCNKMKPVPLQRNASALVGPRNVLLVV